MTNSQQERTRRGERGQIIVLAVVAMFSLLGLAGMAIDISSALLLQRSLRAVADAAALAGAQDLQEAGTRNPPGAAQQTNARNHAMQILVSALHASSTPSGGGCYARFGSGGGCALPGTPYLVSVVTPSPSCLECTDDPNLAVQVGIKNPSFEVTVSQVVGISTWTVSSTSVAAVVHARVYAVVTLRPPKPRANGVDANEDNLFITGGSILDVGHGDVGTNTNAVFAGTNSTIELDPGYHVFYYDPYKAWSGAPVGVQTSTLVPDPHYALPTRTGSTPTYANETQARDTANCAAQQAKVHVNYKVSTGTAIRDLLPAKVVCLKPGIYSYQVTNSTHDMAYLLEPGVYWLDKGLNNSSTIIGGYDPGQPGVALVFPECKNVACQLSGQSSDLIAVNFGDQFRNSGGTRATAANGPQGPVQTPASAGGVLLTLMVSPDPACVVTATAPSACNESENKTLNLPGGGQLFLSGIQYAPSDNVSVKGNSGTQGTFGQLISWTVKYDASFLNLEAARAERSGVLRLDSACSPAVAVCNP